MYTILVPVADLIAILILTFGLYFPRHRRKDLLLSYLAVNIGVLAVSSALGAVSVNAGLGLGLFGVLAIIRLRSAELDQHEIAYYFSALALGIIGGLGGGMGWLALVLMALILAVIALGDSRALFKKYRSQNVVLDVAVANQAELTARLEALLGAKVVSTTVRKLDLVNDVTVVDVRFQLLPTGSNDSLLLQAQEVAR